MGTPQRRQRADHVLPPQPDVALAWEAVLRVARAEVYAGEQVVAALFKVLAAKGVQPFSRFTFKQTYPFLAAGVWAIVMWLFECHPKTLQSSLEVRWPPRGALPAGSCVRLAVAGVHAVPLIR